MLSQSAFGGDLILSENTNKMTWVGAAIGIVADGTGTRINNITKTPAIIAPNGANYNPNAFQQAVVWPNPS